MISLIGLTSTYPERTAKEWTTEQQLIMAVTSYAATLPNAYRWHQNTKKLSSFRNT
ncbi:hypothetical protein QTV43_000382 [Vibrio vulnificus]|nr:hypothetical protein [Vibrio vulnificus]